MDTELGKRRRGVCPREPSAGGGGQGRRPHGHAGKEALCFRGLGSCGPATSYSGQLVNRTQTRGEPAGRRSPGGLGSVGDLLSGESAPAPTPGEEAGTHSTKPARSSGRPRPVVTTIPAVREGRGGGSRCGGGGCVSF